jgi:hypothetical protein
MLTIKILKKITSLTTKKMTSIATIITVIVIKNNKEHIKPPQQLPK